jgi:hypothetical protein
MAINQKPTGKLQVYGDYAVGSVLKSANTIADANGLGALRYQWLLDGKAIAGANSSELVLTKDFVGKVPSLEISYTDGNGTLEKVVSGTNYLSTSYDLYGSKTWISSNAVLNKGVKYTKDNPLNVMQTIQLDWNGDGKEDILTYDSYPLDVATPNPPPSLFLSNGTHLEKTTWTGPALNNPHGVKLLLGDFNEDGHPDVFSLVAVDPPFGKFPDLQDFNNIIFAGPTVRVQEFPQFRGFWYAGASGDINNDGHVDIVMFNFHVGANNVQNQILWNDGKANFRFDTNGLTNLQVDQAELRDVNRDGYLDLVIDKLDNSGRHLSVMWGNGATFEVARSTTMDLPSSFFVSNLLFADLNNDRLDELFVSGVDDKGVYSIFVFGSSNAGKSFTNISASTIESGATNQRFDHLKLEDLDSNGLLDLFAPDMADNIRWEWNGTVFKRITQPLTNNGIWSIDNTQAVYVKEPPQPIVLTGTPQNDLLVGSEYQDKIEALGGNDTITGGLRDDIIDGGTGLDVVKYAGQYGSSMLNNYAIQKLPNGTWTVSFTGPVIAIYPPPWTEGTDTLTNVERLQFSDMSIALDVNGNAGKVAKILGAVFGAEQVSNKTYAGIGLNLLDQGLVSYERLMQLAIEAKLGVGASNAQVVNLLYRNLTKASADANSVGYWTHQIDQGTYSQASLAAMAAELDVNKQNINLVGLMEVGLAYSPAV